MNALNTMMFGSLLLAVAPAVAEQPKPITGMVVSVTDGDTVRVLVDGPTPKTVRLEGMEGDKVRLLAAGSTPIKVRLEGIDAPEKGQPFGAVAAKYLTKLAKGKQCTVIPTGKDKYRRVLGELVVDGESMNSQLVAVGLAWHYKKYSSDKSLAKLEVDAKAQKLGLWKDKKPVPPWEWRKLSKAERTLILSGREGPAQKISEKRDLAYWLNTKSNVRHNSSCRWHGKTKNGRFCTASEGKACGQCGG